LLVETRKNAGAWVPGGWRPLLVAVGALAVALALRQVLHPFMGEHFRFVFFWLAALLVCAYGGIGYGFLVAVSGLALAFYFFVPPYRSFSGLEASDLASITVYLLNTSVLLILIEWLRRSKNETRILMLETSYRNKRLEDILANLAESRKVVDNQSEKIEMLAATAPHIWSMRRSGGTIEYFSADLYEMTGLAPGTLDGEGWTKAMHPNDAQLVKDLSRQVEKSGVSEEIGVRVRLADGKFHRFTVQCSRLEDRHSKVIVWSGPSTEDGVAETPPASPERIEPRPA
jgi:PAS domain S-box-containing protein